MPNFGEDKLKNENPSTKLSGTLGRKRNTIVRSTTRMETLPVNRLLLYRGLPIGKRLAVLCFHVMIEAFFIATVSGTQLTIYFLLFPLRLLVVALGLGLATSVSEWVPAPYAPDYNIKQQTVLSNALVLGVVGFLVVQLFTFFLWQAGLAQLFPASCQEFGKSLWVYSALSFGQLGLLILSGYAQTVGKTTVSFRIQLVGLVLELALLLVGSKILSNWDIVLVVILSAFCRIVESLLLAWALAKEQLLTISLSHISRITARQLLEENEESFLLGLTGSVTLAFSFRFLLAGQGEEGIVTAGIGLIAAGLSFILITVYARALRPVAAHSNSVAKYRRSLRSLGYSLFYGIAFLLGVQVLLFFFQESFLALFALPEELSAGITSLYPLFLITLLAFALGVLLHSFTAAYYQSRWLYLLWATGQIAFLVFLHHYHLTVAVWGVVLWVAVAFLAVSSILFATVLYHMKTKQKQVSV